MLTLIISLIVPLSLVLIFRFLNAERKPAIFGVYQQRNKTYFLKFIVLYLFLRSRQLIRHLRRLRAVDVGRSDDGTIKPHEQDEPLEKKYYLGDYPLAVDAVYYNGMSKEGAALVCGLACRAHHDVDAFMYLKVEGEELLLTPNLPDTCATQTAVEQGHYKSGGLSIVNFIPMRTWEVTYSGEMKTKDGKKMDVELSVTWSAHFGHFNYDTQMAPLSMASDMAREAWSADYFKLLKKFHQTRYEQMGHLLGTVTINGLTTDISMPCVRDHSFGNYRDWRNFHRYVLHFLYLENGDCLTVGCVSQPVVISHLTIGYLCRKADQTIFPVKSTDFKLYQHGENGILPKDYGFSFKAGGERYVVKVLVDEEDSFFMGKDREAKIYERWCTAEVNGLKGWGCAEWHYNNTRK
ncbi:uncharacterized protein LOC134743893 [Cydia strobilella]|uniref:uncharacterized protein LOC134743893 n=1 Tax=Cydia strobilella TaxID=1100964 RepID=UPI0030041895